MPRMPRQLTAQARRFLEEQRFAVLATINADGTPQQSPVWYELQGDEIMMNTRRGRLKDRNLRRDPRCSVCVEGEYDWITIRGIARLIDDPATAQADIHHLSVINHGPEIAAQQMTDQFSREERVTIRLSIEHVTGENLDD
jgi:PPOX class probable F420-dependent enzyme